MTQLLKNILNITSNLCNDIGTNFAQLTIFNLIELELDNINNTTNYKDKGLNDYDVVLAIERYSKFSESYEETIKYNMLEAIDSYVEFRESI